MTTVEEAKKRGPERHLTSSYNFAGPGTFYAARMKGSDFYENLMKVTDSLSGKNKRK